MGPFSKNEIKSVPFDVFAGTTGYDDQKRDNPMSYTIL